MALITTTGSLIRQYNAFTGLSATERSQSGIARAEIVYYNVNDSWPSPGAGNNRLYQTGQLDLPKDFGYVLTDAYMLVSRAGLVECETVAQLRIFPGGILGPQVNLTLESPAGRQDGTGSTPIGDIAAENYNSIFPSLGGANGSLVYHLTSKPTNLIYPFGANTYTSTPNPASVWELALGEQKVAGAEYDVSLFVRFLQYDIDQSYNYVIQSPQLTR